MDTITLTIEDYHSRYASVLFEWEIGMGNYVDDTAKFVTLTKSQYLKLEQLLRKNEIEITTSEL